MPSWRDFFTDCNLLLGRVAEGGAEPAAQLLLQAGFALGREGVQEGVAEEMHLRPRVTGASGAVTLTKSTLKR